MATQNEALRATLDMVVDLNLIDEDRIGAVIADENGLAHVEDWRLFDFLAERIRPRVGIIVSYLADSDAEKSTA